MHRLGATRPVLPAENAMPGHYMQEFFAPGTYCTYRVILGIQVYCRTPAMNRKYRAIVQVLEAMPAMKAFYFCMQAFLFQLCKCIIEQRPEMLMYCDFFFRKPRM